MNNAKTTAPINTAPDAVLEQIALDHFFVETLQIRQSDQLDFHEVSVWAIKSALQAAFVAGQQAAATRQPAAKKALKAG